MGDWNLVVGKLREGNFFDYIPSARNESSDAHYLIKFKHRLESNKKNFEKLYSDLTHKETK